MCTLTSTCTWAHSLRRGSVCTYVYICVQGLTRFARVCRVMSERVGRAIIKSLCNSFFLKIFSFILTIITVRYSSVSDYGEISLYLPLIVSVSTFFLKEGFRRSALKCDDYRVSIQICVLGCLMASVWTTGVVCWWFTTTHTPLRTCATLYLALIIDIFAEPFLVHHIVHNQNLTIRSQTDLFANIARSVVLLLCTIATVQCQLAFGIAQFAYSLLWFSFLFTRLPVSLFLPIHINTTTRMSLSEFVLMSVQKLFLAEGEKFLTLMYLSSESVGKLSLVNNLGSLVLRLIYAPIEDIAFSACTQSKSKTERIKVLQSVLLVEILVGLTGLAFAVPVCQSIVYLLYGTVWSSDPELVLLLQVYVSVLLILFAANGALEAYYFAVANSVQIRTSFVYQWAAFAVLTICICGLSATTNYEPGLMILIGNGLSMIVRITGTLQIFNSWKNMFHPLFKTLTMRVLVGGIILRIILLYLDTNTPFAQLGTSCVCAAATLASIFRPVKTVLIDNIKRE